jgi:hypothetical protein
MFFTKKLCATKYFFQKKNVAFGRFFAPKKETSTQDNWQANF